MFLGKRLIAASILVTSCLFPILLSQSALAQVANNAPATPAGWTKAAQRRPTATVFKPRKLKAPDSVAVKFYQRTLLNGARPEDWLKNKLLTGKAPKSGAWTSDPDLLRLNANFATCSRQFKTKNGLNCQMFAVAATVDQQYVRMSAIISTTSPATKPFQEPARKLVNDLLKLEKAAAISDQRGFSIEGSPPKVKELTTGIRITPGRYVGNSVYDKDNRISQRFDIVLFENGEYERLNVDKDRDRVGRYEYSAASGMLELFRDLDNDTRDWDRYCVYGKKRGKPIIYARDLIGSSSTTILRLVDQKKRPTPTERKAARAIAEEEAKRYRLVVEPGEGISDGKIECLLHTSRMRVRGSGVALDEYSYLLLKDGTVMGGPPVAPTTIDEAASRLREVDRWGTWRKKEAGYTFAWPSRPDRMQAPKGKQFVGVPFEAGISLDGTFEAASSASDLVSGYSSANWWGVRLAKNGRFIKYRRGMTQAGGVPGMEALVSSTYDDEGSIVSVSSNAMVALAEKKTTGTLSHRSGYYELSGYRLTLKYDDGRVHHLPTFTNKSRDMLWFEGHRLTLKKPEKK